MDEDFTFHTTGAGGLSWTLVFMSIGAWVGYTMLALEEHGELAAGPGGYVRLAGAAVPFLFGLFAVVLRRDAGSVIQQGMRRDYLILLAPIVGAFAGLIAIARASAGVFGGGTTVYNDGAHVVHHKTAEDAPAPDRIFGVLLFLTSAVGIHLAYYLAAAALGIDLRPDMR